MHVFGRRIRAAGSGRNHLGLSVVLPALLVAAILQAPIQNASATSDPIPVLAYYYIWFDVKSWDRAKTDYPLLGRYSSDDPDVMHQHIRWAEAAGINGFIVSWKSTEKLNRRLEQLIEIAEEEDFKLVIIYQGLDFERNPLPVEQVAADLDHFMEHYAASQVFDIFEKPVVIWSGTWEFSREDVSSVSQGRRGRLLLLASEKNVDGYQRLAGLVDGNAYYWSSVNPATYPGYLEKLAAISQAVHETGGLWVAPAAPGFDARLVGGTSVVERKNGETLRKEMNTALQSAPDAIGLISWNEFSENSHIEPSENFGSHYLDVLAEIRQTDAPVIGVFDSSEPGNTLDDFLSVRFIALSMIVALIIGGLAMIAGRQFAGRS